MLYRHLCTVYSKANATIHFITYKIETRYMPLENNQPAYSSKSFGDMVTQPYTEHDFLVLLLFLMWNYCET